MIDLVKTVYVTVCVFISLISQLFIFFFQGADSMEITSSAAQDETDASSGVS